MEAKGNSSSSSSTVANKKLMNMNNEDRISGLHEPLIHHILSFMDMKEVIQTSLLSKRWTNLWRSVRTLKFHEHSWTNRCNRWNGRNPKLKKNRVTKFKFFIDTVLFLRDGSDIYKFDLYFFFAEYDDSRLIDRWVTYAQKRRVQVLRLGGVSILPLTTVCLSGRVKTLEILRISLSSDGHGVLVLDLPIVESFIIYNCDHIEVRRLAISGPKLKYLQLENIVPGINYKTSIKISAAPSLASLKCIGYTYEDYTLENLLALVTAEIETYLYYVETLNISFGRCLSNILKGITNAKSLTLSGHGFQVCFLSSFSIVKMASTSIGRCLSNILKGITNAKSLTLSGHGFQAFEEFPNMLEGVPVLVQSLNYLKLTEWCDKSYIYSLAKLLEVFPLLETLVLERTERIIGPEDERGDWDAELSFTCKPRQLKCIEMQNFEGSEKEFKFLEFLLKSALVLKKVGITLTIKLSGKEKELAELNKKIQSLQKSFSEVTILLNLKTVL